LVALLVLVLVAVLVATVAAILDYRRKRQRVLSGWAKQQARKRTEESEPPGSAPTPPVLN